MLIERRMVTAWQQWPTTMNAIRDNKMMRTNWQRYIQQHTFAKQITFDQTLAVIESLVKRAIIG